MDERKIKIISRAITVGLCVALFIYVLYKNYPLFGESIVLSESEISDLTPSDRVIKYKGPVAQIGDFVYFKTKSKGFDNAKITITFNNTHIDQQIFVGYRDQADWHYKMSPGNLPIIENLDWQRTGSGPYLYQKSPIFRSVENFLKSPPQDTIVGTYNTASNHFIDFLAGYAPKTEPTVINTLLRGSHVFYTYIQDEPFHLSLEKQDLNWYEGEDTVEIKIYKDGALITRRIIDDDGVPDNSKTVMQPQKTDIKYEGGNPENGVYQVVIDANSDTVIKSLTSSFSKIVFEDSIYPIGSSLLYDPMISGTTPPLLYTESPRLIFSTPHQYSTQSVKINDEEVAIPEAGVPFIYNLYTKKGWVSAPQGDVKIEGMGYFAYRLEQYFNPYIYNHYEIKKAEDLEYVDYLLTDYQKIVNANAEWKTTTLEYNLSDAYYTKGELTWLIKAPGLKESGEKVYIKDIKVELSKKPIIGI